MRHTIDTIAKKISLLNQTTIDSMLEKDDRAIIKNFTETGIKILGANFGFAWWKFHDNEEYKLAYKSLNTPYEPTLPRERAGNYIARKTKKPFFDSNVKKENYEFDISRYMKSYFIIPISHREHIYGNLVFCYKNSHDFNQNDLALSNAVGNSTAQAITIHRLVKTDILLHQEKLKSEFIANATHELRTPLAIMKGNLDLARMGPVNLTSLKKALVAVSLEVNILSETLKDLSLLTSSVKNNAQVMNATRINIAELVSQTAQRLGAMANEKKISIELKSGSIDDLLIYGDKKYLEKLFLNLIKNAITYGKQDGTIIIDITKDKKTAKIEISDNGIGISKEDLPKIFERFYRADKAHSSYGSHSGLGLAIAKWVAGIHEGAITVKSTFGVGSTFTVVLPLRKKNSK